jgi:filamin
MDPELDAQWKKIQEKTFTRWVNEQLKVQKVAVKTLSEDFADGVLLIVLLEVLSQKSVGKYNKKPRVHAQKMENIEKVLKFIGDQGIKLVNIGSGDIIEGNLKLILGLVWTLILHYQISMGFNIDDDDDQSGVKKTGKQALLEYIQNKIPHKNIKNFTSDWNDGTAIAALVEAHAPGLCPEADSMDPNHALENATTAMSLADDWLGVPQVLGPEDMTNPHVDELSMMTYLSKFPESQLKEGAPLHSKQDKIPTDINKVAVSGPGITGEGAQPNQPASIFVDCSDSGVAPIVGSVKSPSGDVTPIEFKPTKKSPNVFEGSYIPKETGNHGVNVEFDGEVLPICPIEVPIGDPTAVRLDGEGLKRAFVGDDYDNVIDVFTENAGPGVVTAEFNGPSPVAQKIVKIDDDHHQIHYKVDTPGKYEAVTCYNGVPVEKAPRIIPTIDLSKVKVSGPGVESGNPAKSETYFDVDARPAGDAEIKVSVIDPEGREVPLKVEEPAKNAKRIRYTPVEVGDHTIHVQYADKDVPQFPHVITVDEPAYVICTGDGLKEAIANQKAQFTVDSRKVGSGSLGLKMEGPAEITDVVVNDEEPGLFNVTYSAPIPGIYDIHITFNDEVVPGAPFRVNVKNNRGDPDVTKCIVDGIDQPGAFKVDCSNAGGTGHLEVGVFGAYVPADYIAVKHNGDYTFSVSYNINDPGETTITVKWHGQHLEGSPFIIVT